MREGLRRFLIRSAWVGLLVCGGALLGLRSGRPLYYSDGQQQTAAGELAHGAMQVFATPQPECELPGPVLGRVAQLPDGRLVYGRGQADGTADLVLFDPRRPALPPEPAYGLDTAAHELAPACGADGTCYFASDRPGGAGGYDLYRTSFRGGAFTAPEPVLAANSGFDETDPAPSPDGRELVFVRIDRSRADGENGTLMRLLLEPGALPEPLFPTVAAADRRPAEDRDPVFTRDGAALLFVRREPGATPHLLSSSRLGDRYGPPLRLDAAWGSAPMRSPLPAIDGRLLLLQPGSPDLLQAAPVRVLYPWWPGQAWIEVWLLAMAGVCVVLLLLLHLGRRWSTLDTVTQCLLLSLLLHLLVLLWLRTVAITQGLLPGGEDADATGVSVQLLPPSSSTGGAGDGPQHEDLAAAVRFAPEQRRLDAVADAPAPAPETASRPAAEELLPATSLPAAASAGVTPGGVVDVQDVVEATALHQGQDQASAAPAATALPELRPVAAGATAAAVARAVANPDRIQVRLPEAALGEAERGDPSALLAAGSAGAAPLPPANLGPALQPAPVALQDAGAVSDQAVRHGVEVAPTTVASRSVELVAPAVGGGAGTATRVAAPTMPAAVTTPGSDLGGRVGHGELLAAAGDRPAPSARRSAGAAPPAGLHDAGTSLPQPAAAGPVARATEPRPSSQVGAPAAPRAAAVAAPPLADHGPASMPTVAAVAPPAANLEAGPTRRSPLAGATVERSAALPSARPRPAAALRDLPAEGATAATAPRPLAAAAAPVQPLAAALRLPTAPASRPDRPVRRGAAALVPAPLPEAPPPGSLLERQAGGGIAAAAAPVAAGATPYSNRFGPAKAKALEQYGGTAATERAVAMGLRYLASIQHEDGAFGDRDRFDDKYGLVFVGKTALCLLAFLGAGHTPTSQTEYSANTARAVELLLSVQDPNDGSFGPSSAYGHGIATYALAECYALTKEPRLQVPLQAAVDWILRNQGPRHDRRNQGGWGYFAPQLPREDDYARTSVSSWMVMALESARLSGIVVPDAALAGARSFFEQAWDKENQWFRYNHKPSRLNSAWPTLPASTPAGAFSLLLLGVPKDDPRIVAAADFTADRRPEAYRRYDDDAFVLRGAGNVYFWYYGSLCCFLAGGEAWERWNATLRTVLPQGQQPDGSFPPIDVYAGYAGDTRKDRSYTTAMCVLSLEIYYRYFTPLLVGR